MTITGVNNSDQSGDVVVTVSTTAENTSNQGVIAPEPVALAVVDDETTPEVSLSLSQEEVIEGGGRDEGRAFIIAELDNRSSAATTVRVSVSLSDAVTLSGSRTLTIPAGQTASDGWAWIYAEDDTEFVTTKKIVTVSGRATNPQGVTGPESVTLTIIDDDAPIFADDNISFAFTAGVAGSRVLPQAEYGNEPLTYSISPALSNGVTFVPGPPARIGVLETSVASGETSYTLTATDAQGDTDTMTVNITVLEGVCPNSAAVSGYADPGIVADCEALLGSRDVLRDEQSLNWSEHLSIDKWQGVEIVDSRIVGIELASLDLSGTIPSELAKLSKLRRLVLISNKLNGPIPPELGNLAELQLLDLRWNRLTGEIPSQLGELSNLQQLKLGDNKLSGPIPPELGRLANLETLFLSHSRLSGEIPSELGNLANLQSLGLGSSQLSGPIPVSLAVCPRKGFSR